MTAKAIDYMNQYERGQVYIITDIPVTPAPPPPPPEPVTKAFVVTFDNTSWAGVLTRQ